MNIVQWWTSFTQKKRSHEASARHAIDDIIKKADPTTDSSLEPEEKLLLANILELRDLTTKDIMTPRVDIEGISVNITYPELLKVVANAGYSRFPVYGESLDEILGCLHVKDFNKADPEHFNCRDALSQVLFVPSSTQLLELLIRMKGSQVTMAFVVDEFGGIDGLVTSWDIIREILGDIDTLPLNDMKRTITHLSDQSLMVDGRFALEALRPELPGLISRTEEEKYNTVAELIMALAGRVPAAHELIEHTSGLQFEVLDTDGRRIKQVRIYPPARE